MVTEPLPAKVRGLTVPAASAGPRARGPMVALPNTTGARPNVLSRRTLTLSPAIVTRATMRTVALVILVSPSACWDVPHAVAQVWFAFWATAAGNGHSKPAAAKASKISPDLLVMLSSRFANARDIFRLIWAGTLAEFIRPRGHAEPPT